MFFFKKFVLSHSKWELQSKVRIEVQYLWSWRIVKITFAQKAVIFVFSIHLTEKITTQSQWLWHFFRLQTRNRVSKTKTPHAKNWSFCWETACFILMISARFLPLLSQKTSTKIEFEMMSTIKAIPSIICFYHFGNALRHISLESRTLEMPILFWFGLEKLLIFAANGF